jgi:cytoskeletal protein CcmA (bactofilin family)
MFGRGSNAKIEKEKDNPDDLDMKRAEGKGAVNGGKTLSVVPLHTSHHEGTVIGEGVIIEGNISGAGNITIEGRVRGNVEVKADSITIGPKGRVEGDVVARQATVSGRMDGKIGASESVTITRSADFCGEIKAGRIAIDDGAFFEGNIELNREPNRKVVSRGMPTGKTSEKQDRTVRIAVAEPTKDGNV